MAEGDHDESEDRDEDDRDDDDEDNEDKKSGKDDKDDGKPSFLQSPLFKIGAAIVVVVAIVIGVIWWLIARKYEDTDDAFIDTHIVHISPQIAGQVLQVHVNDNQLVHKGDLLVVIDPADANAKLVQVQAQETQAETQYFQALATERGAAAQASNAARDLARYRLLQRTSPQAVAQEQVDQAVATQKNAAAQRDAAQAQISGALAQIKVYKAQIAAAQLSVGYTHIVAPIDGHIAQKSVATGNYVSPGQDLLAIVPLQLWVTANFKETQLTRMRVGQRVHLDIDACDAKVKGRVSSIQRGAGQAFGILPPENATGNYVKVVQRVPVKIVLGRLPPNCALGPGMSVEPSVKVR
ncbi:MAG TPA: HlyD family secretion protein [Rhizomicrobium sp.]|jgi:membrane fusion protein (multidrug efflux system)